nr:hypothetical protein [uncultured Rhodoferax sp.]
MNTLTLEELASTLEESKVLAVIDNGPMRTFTVEHHGQDILIFEASGHVSVIYPCAAFDAESGGSIHDHARACLAG